MKKNVTLFITSDFISQFSAGIVLAALNWYIIDVYQSNSLVATIANIDVIAGLIISLVAVGLLKRMNSKRIALMSYFFRVIFIALPLILLKLGIDDRLAIYLLALSNGIGWNLYFPASKDILNSFTVEENTLQLNSFAEISMQVGLFSAALVSGILYRYIGFENILLLGTSLFFAALIIFALVKYQESDKVEAIEQQGVFAYLIGHKWLLILGLVLYIPFIGANVINTTLPGYIQAHLSGNSISYGFTDTMYGVGACLAGVLLPVIAKFINKEHLIFPLFSIAVLLGVVLVLNHSLALTAGYIFLLGSVGPAIRTIIYTRTMEIVPGKLLGPLVSVWNFINLIFQFVANYSVGRVMDIVGPQWGFMIYASTMLLGILLFIGIKNRYRA